MRGIGRNLFSLGGALLIIAVMAAVAAIGWKYGQNSRFGS